MQHGRSANADTHTGSAHACGCSYTGTAQHLPTLIDAHTDAYRAKACAHTRAEASTPQPQAHGKRPNRNTNADARPHGATT